MTSLTRRDLLVSGLALSASTLVPGSVQRAHALLARYPAAEPAGALAPRERLLFDFGWKFFQGHGSDPARDLGFGKGQGDFAKSGEFWFSTQKFDDSTWRDLNLPHDWAVELPFVRDEEQQSHGYKPLGRRYPETSVGWYRRTFDIPKEDSGKRIVVEFDGAFRSALVFLNGYFIGRNDNGYAPFRFDVSDFLRYGEKNYLVVRMDASFGDGWFYEGAGIYRHVWLSKSEPVHLGHCESYIRTTLKGNAASLNLGTIVQNEGAQAETCRVRWQIFDAAGKIVATADSAAQPVAVDGSAVFTASTNLPSPALWSPETPNLYSAVVTLEIAGKACDAERITFGVRDIRWDPDKGFFLNGKHVLIKGTCNHQDHAGVGAALPDRLQAFRIAVLKDMGGNAVRTSHNMPTPEWVEACDRMGMMMMCETRQMSSNPEGMAQLETMIKRYRNSPSIILWSVGNEEWTMMPQPQGVRVVDEMIKRSHELDPTRRCSAAVNASFETHFPEQLDVMGFNYNLKVHDKYHKDHPKQASVGSETASTVSTRGIYVTDKLRNWVSAYDLNHTAWSQLTEEWWKFYAAREWLSGGFAWTGFDYRGEPTPYGWPSINSQFGIVDMCGFPKDNFYYYKAWWGSEPVLHLFPHWNWEQREGEPISVWVHSNLDSVELFLNGNSQGSKKVEPLTHLEWMVKYEPGVLEARGTKDGKVVLAEKRETTGEPESIRLTPDRTEINADGEDVCVLRVEVLDKEGRTVPTADVPILFKVSGEGGLIGVGNGDPNCQESDKEPKRSLFNGLAQVIVQSTRTPGAITVEAYTGDWPPPKLPPTQVKITTKKADLRPSVA
ncbi:MAG TPA: beta-galactosidase GalA [Candidatus Binatia bacterium]|nr:beta-galactosidase GalA [Candidatus Sulfotelmatobacter sp.]HXJ86792.1 beta-galactosidase GalA [Candidatus Binatia bacterium]